MRRRVDGWRKRAQSRADLDSLRDESDHEEYLDILTELAANEMLWKAFVADALARSDHGELEEVALIA